MSNLTICPLSSRGHPAALNPKHATLYFALSFSSVNFLIWAILVIAVNGLFRLGKLVSASQNKGDVPRVASVSSPDINVRNIRLERSKTDPFANEVDVSVGSNSSKRFNAVRLLDKMVKDNFPSDFIFSHPITGKPITRNNVVDRLKSAISTIGLDMTNFSGHSCRAGGAQSLEDLGFSSDQIKEIGRWKSYCWSVYRTMPVWKFIVISQTMLSHVDQHRLSSLHRSAYFAT